MGGQWSKGRSAAPGFAPADRPSLGGVFGQDQTSKRLLCGRSWLNLGADFDQMLGSGEQFHFDSSIDLRHPVSGEPSFYDIPPSTRAAPRGIPDRFPC